MSVNSRPAPEPSRLDVLYNKLMSPTGLTPEENSEVQRLVDKQVAWGLAAAETVAAVITKRLSAERNKQRGWEVNLWLKLKCWAFGHVYEAKGFTGTGVRCSRCGEERRIPGMKEADVPERLRKALGLRKGKEKNNADHN